MQLLWNSPYQLFFYRDPFKMIQNTSDSCKEQINLKYHGCRQVMRYSVW